MPEFAATQDQETRPGRCPACGGDDVHAFYHVSEAPTNSCLLFHSVDEARACPTGSIDLTHCRRCGFVYNAAFDFSRTEYSSRYEETQGFSQTFNRFHRELAQQLIDRHNLRGGRVVEVGCGKGEFLLLLAELGDIDGVGVDPSAIPERIVGQPAAERVRLIPEFYSEAHGNEAADAVICKMTLEHIPAVAQFVSTIRRSLVGREDTLVFFQIPETGRILKTCAFEDVYYEHCSYFSPGSLGRLFRRCGFDVLDIGVEYDGQYLTIEARPALAEPTPPLPMEDDLASISAYVEQFGARAEAAQARWKKLIEGARREGERIVIWGSGSKAVSFLGAIGGDDAIDAVVDINPNRQGCYMPITGHRILGPQELRDLSPGLVIVMNRIYVPEIRAELHTLGLHPKIDAL